MVCIAGNFSHSDNDIVITVYDTVLEIGHYQHQVNGKYNGIVFKIRERLYKLA